MAILPRFVARYSTQERLSGSHLAPREGDLPAGEVLAADGRAGETIRQRLRGALWARWIGYPAAVFVSSRVVALGSVWAALRIRPSPLHFGVLGRWDGAWYIAASSQGYSHTVPALLGGKGAAGESTHAFFPLLPVLLRAGHAIGLPYVAAGLLVDSLGGIAAAMLLWRLVSSLGGPEAADRAVALFCFFPGAYVFSLVYAEPLLLAFAVGCLLALHSRRWVVAGALAALATATRPNAWVLVLCCAFEAGRFIWRSADRKRCLGAVLAPLLAPLGTLGFFAFLWRRTGDALVWFTVERRGWAQSLSVSYPVHQSWLVLQHPLADLNRTVSVIGLVVILVTGYFLARTRPPAVLWIYTVGTVAMSLGGNAFAHPRFILTAFPLVSAVGQRLRWPALGPVLGVSGACMAGLMMLFMVTTLVVP